MSAKDSQLSIYASKDDELKRLTCIWICNQDESIEATFDAYANVLRDIQLEVEWLVINNGLGEHMGNRIAAKLKEASMPSSVVSFSMPCPESEALSTAFQHTRGDVLVLLPAYPQSAPEDIPRMLNAVRNGLDYCASWRTPRIDAPREQRKSKLFNLAVHWFAGLRLHDINSGLRMMRREVVEDIPLYGDLHIYLPVLAARQGFSVGEVPVRHLEERASVSGHGMGVYPRRAMDLLTLFFLTRFTQKPFRFFGSIGAGLFLTGGIINVFLAIQKLVFEQDLANRPALVLGTLLMVLGIQTFSLGLLGELIIFVSAGGFADYRIKKIHEKSNPPRANACEPANRHEDTV